MSGYPASKKRKSDGESAASARTLRLDRPLVVLDVATTGRSFKSDRIVEIVAVKIHPNLERDAPWRVLVKPGKSILPGASYHHRLYDRDVVDSPTFAQQAPHLLQLLNDCDISGYNINGFDLKVLTKEFERAGITFPTEGMHVVDSKRIFEKMVNHSIDSALRFYCGGRIPTTGSPRVDAVAAADILLAQLGKHEDLPSDVSALHDFSLPRGNAQADNSVSSQPLIESYLTINPGTTTNVRPEAPPSSTPPNNRADASPPHTPPPTRRRARPASPSAGVCAEPPPANMESEVQQPASQSEVQQPASQPDPSTTSYLASPPTTVPTRRSRRLQMGDDLVDYEGWLIWNGDDAVIAFGKYGFPEFRALRDLAQDHETRKYLEWMGGEKSSFPKDVKAIVQGALEGKFPTRSEAPALPVAALFDNGNEPPSPSPMGRPIRR